MQKRDTIIFDLGGVLVDWNPEYVYKTIFEKKDEMDWFLQNITSADWNEAQDGGRTIQEANEILIRSFPEHEANIRAYYERWEEMLGGPIEGTVEIFRRLKKDPALKFYALTNWSAETFPVALARYDFLHWFDGRLVSGEEKTRKPFIGIYELLLSRFSIDPTRAIYIDDNARNLAPAASLGIETILFRNPTQLEADLEHLLSRQTAAE